VEYKKALHLVQIKNTFMKKLLLSISLVVASFAANAQCTPLQSWADTTDYGVYPDTIQNFPPASVNVAYITDLNFKVPIDATLASDEAPAGSTIENFTVTSVTGLPTGYSYACNIASCTYDGGVNGCASVSGTTAEAGTYNITINVTANVKINPILPALPTPSSFTGYKIIVGTTGTVEQVIAPIYVSPNPANEMIKVSGMSASMKASKITITNVEGKVVANKNIQSAADYEFDLSNVKAGIYFVNVTHATGVETVKFVKQ
jgi:hypothetical protein